MATKEWIMNHPEKIKEYEAKRRNSPKRVSYLKKWRQDNKNRCYELHKRWLLEHPKRAKESQSRADKNYTKNHPNARREISKRWRLRHPEQVKEITKKPLHIT